VIGVVAVRKIDARDVQAGAAHVGEDLNIVSGGPEGGHDLGAA
jgi:hypothetical protein